jgi:hypothetical protein
MQTSSDAGTRARAATWLANSLWVLCVALFAAVVWLVHASDPPRLPVQIFVLAEFLAFVSVGAVVSSRRPENPIGWLFCAVALSNLLWAFAWQYAVYALMTTPGSLPGGKIMAWLGTGWLANIGWGLMVIFVPILFPTGKLPSPRWRPVAWLAAILLAMSIVVFAFRPGPISSEGPPVTNPLGIERAAHAIQHADTVLSLCTVLVMIAAVASVVMRFRRARGEERQQIKWFAYSAALLASAVGFGILSNYVPALPLASAIPAVQGVGIASVPVATGIAVLKYRLYDIDILINRTLVYGSLTATLLTLYFGGIVVSQRLFVLLTGEQSTLAVVASTLLIAALFNPLRRRIQSFIDRRFYRRKYDARKSLEAFSTKLRDETDLASLNSELVGVVNETVQPTHVSLWLRPEPILRKSGVPEQID